MKFVMPLVAALSLSACMSVDGGAEVTRSVSGVSSCPQLGGMAAQYLTGDNVRCGPQTELPYTLQ